MTKSILRNLPVSKMYFSESLHEEMLGLDNTNIKKWIRNNTSRIEFKIASSESKYALSLLESLVQFKFNPVFEGKLAIKGIL